MSPDLEWRVGDGAEEETIVQIAPRAHWRKAIIGLMVAMGAGLGIAYASIPAPPRLPVPTPPLTVTPQPSTLYPSPDEVIEQEVSALSGGDDQTYMSIQDPNDPHWRQAQLASFTIWGTPPYPEQLYTIIDSGRLPNGGAWADIIQYRKAQFFREMRFYRWNNNRWVRTRPSLAPSFWGPERTAHTAHFDLVFRERDEVLVRVVASEFEQLYTIACHGLSCNDEPLPQRPFQLVMLPDVEQPHAHVERSGQAIVVSLPSPSVLGLYVLQLNGGLPAPDERFKDIFDRYMRLSIAYRAAGGVDYWLTHRDGVTLVWAINNWQRARSGAGTPDQTLYQPELLKHNDLLSLKSLWAWTPMPGLQDLIWAESGALIKFIDEEYGSATVIKLLKALPTARSMPQAIENAGLSFDQVDARWNEWLKQYRSDIRMGRRR